MNWDPILWARMAELVDALVSGTSDRKVVEVQVLFRAPFFNFVYLIPQAALKGKLCHRRRA
jgi:hypothetical protein